MVFEFFRIGHGGGTYPLLDLTCVLARTTFNKRALHGRQLTVAMLDVILQMTAVLQLMMSLKLFQLLFDLDILRWSFEFLLFSSLFGYFSIATFWRFDFLKQSRIFKLTESLSQHRVRLNLKLRFTLIVKKVLRLRLIDVLFGHLNT